MTKLLHPFLPNKPAAKHDRCWPVMTTIDYCWLLLTGFDRYPHTRLPLSFGFGSGLVRKWGTFCEERAKEGGGLWVVGYGLWVVGWELHRDTLRKERFTEGCGLWVSENSWLETLNLQLITNQACFEFQMKDVLITNNLQPTTYNLKLYGKP